MIRAALAAVLFLGTAASAEENPVIRVETPFDNFTIGIADVAGAEVSIGPTGSGVALSLSANASQQFRDATERAIGESLSIYVCDDRIMTASVQVPIEGHIILPASGIEGADLLAEVLRGDTACADYHPD